MANCLPVSTSQAKLTNPYPPSAICLISLNFLPEMRWMEKFVNKLSTYRIQLPILLLQHRMSARNYGLQGISQQVQSEYSEGGDKKKIPQEVLEKYLTVGNGAFLKYFDKAVGKIQPLWAITQSQMGENIKGVFTGEWTFSQNNKSIYWVIWGPISLVFFCYLLHSAPFQNKLNLTSAGFIDLGLILILSFAMFIFSNVMHFPFDKFVYVIFHRFQHACISSHVNLLAIVHCIVNVAGPDILVIPMSVVYIGLCTFLHFRIYNSAIKPTLLEFIILLVIIAALYTTAAYLFYVFLFKTSDPLLQSKEKATKHQHFLALRYFNF